MSSSSLYSEVWLCRDGGCQQPVIYYRQSPDFGVFFKRSPVEIYMRSARSWRLGEVSALLRVKAGAPNSARTVANVCYLGRQPKEFVFFFFGNFPWLPRPSHFVHLNLTYDSGLIVVIILLIMAMTLYIPPFPSAALRIAVFFWAVGKRGMRFPPGQRFARFS